MTTDAPTLLPAPLLSASARPVLLDDSLRGVPPGTADLSAADLPLLRWHPADGRMALPVLTLDETAFRANRDLFLSYAREQGVAVAPHAKTPMAPDLARALVEGGAWGTTVADIRQAGVMLRAGLDRLILANGIGGAGGAGRLAALIRRYPGALLHVFVDSVAAASALAAAWRADPALPPLRVLAETGAARGGARSLAEVEAILDVVLASGGRLEPAGVATYEGAAAVASPERTLEIIAGLLELTAEAFALLRRRLGDRRPLIVTAGGSVFFDRVIAALGPVVAADGAAELVLRSGAIFFHDHGVYDRAFAALDARQGFHPGGAPAAARALFRPALRLWAEVLSRPEPGLAVCGLGMRDASFDQGFPSALAIWRDGRRQDRPPAAEVTKLNDQHAFLALGPGADIRVGDVVEFGISHPCTCLDRYRVLFGADGKGFVQHAFPTFFG
ncbi:alanine racemase [Labrys wisconsinensis]|uniref:D-serine dehydratase n=1 Tax=Labrys wisconsinensis TaxID=425677 RepID=A0ABU0J0P2_9HYPH|nr:alanine racemase [Labrys wisconsinensis]MDQ0467825.1 D-serine dehydratase [Labrys wisconsinensis]